MTHCVWVTSARIEIFIQCQYLTWSFSQATSWVCYLLSKGIFCLLVRTGCPGLILFRLQSRAAKLATFSLFLASTAGICSYAIVNTNTPRLSYTTFTFLGVIYSGFFHVFAATAVCMMDFGQITMPGILDEVARSRHYTGFFMKKVLLQHFVRWQAMPEC